MINLSARAARIRMIVLDVDGTLTDGAVTYDDGGGETKTFHIADGLGIVMAIAAGLRIAVITGRRSEIVRRRMAELGVDNVVQAAGDKGETLRRLRQGHGLSRDEVSYVGDDINDLPAFDEAGLCIAVANASEPVLRRADFVTAKSGGHGAVREAIDTILRAQGRSEEAVELYMQFIRGGSAPQ
ncbi:MAG: KdsC family phosphatase [Capsulimonadaceae bacterium]